MRRRRILLFLVTLAIILFFALDGDDYLTLELIRTQLANFQALFDDSLLKMAGGFFLLYVAAASLSIPGTALLPLVSGALFGLGWGLLIASFASAIGASLAFLLARTLLRGFVERRFRKPLRTINRGLERDGSFYLFSLRLVPVFPFFIVNLAMGLTRLKLRTFYLVSQVGMLPSVAVYTIAGEQLSELESLADILSLEMLFSLILLGLLPLLGKRISNVARSRRERWEHRRPRAFDYDIVVIGAGCAGLTASHIASAMEARVALVDKHDMGGADVNTGSVPSKALTRAARAAQDMRAAARFGVHGNEPRIDFAEVMAYVRDAIRAAQSHVDPGIDVIEGAAHLESPWVVRVGERRLAARHIVIATGARPKIPDLPGLECIDVLTSENLWSLEMLPERLVILGGDSIGCELGQSFARLGSRVTLIESGPRLLAREDAEVGELLRHQLASEGIDIRTHTWAIGVESDDQGNHALVAEFDGKRDVLPFDRLLVDVGRQANVSGLGLEELGIETTDEGALEVNELLQSRYTNIWACGEVCGPYPLAHVGAYQARHATINALFGEFRTFATDYHIMPVVTYVQPEIARVGLNEQEAQTQGIDYEVTRYAMTESDRALAEDATAGFVKVLTVPGRDRILGATLVGENAGEYLAEFTLAMKRGIRLGKLLDTLHPHPTFSEANRAVAAAWKRAHRHERTLRWLRRYFAWRRG